MADYTVNKSDGTILAVVTDGAIDSSSASISFVGRNIIDYGESIAENQVHIMENFSSTSSPSNPISGQLWWDTSIDILNVYDGSNFLGVLLNIIEDTSPQLGGNLDHNGFSVTTDGNPVLGFSSDGEGAINWVEIENATTGTGPVVRSVGADTDIDLHISAKGAGIVNLGSGGVRLNAALDGEGNAITNIGSPGGPSDAATKDYVDTEVAGATAGPPAFRLDPAPGVVVGPSDEIIVLSSGGPGQSVILPPAIALPPGTTLTLKNGLGTSGSVITPDGADTIDGTPGPNGGLLVAPLAFTRLATDGTSIWYVI